MKKRDLLDTWLSFKHSNACSIDRMLCDPNLRRNFLEFARRDIDRNDEFEILWSLVSLRKRKAIPKVGSRNGPE